MRAPHNLPDYAIEVSGLKKTYRGQGKAPAKVALHGIDLQIRRGSIFGLLGPNGAGKSTLINILAGLVVKSEGTAKVWGYDIDERPREASAALGVVPQELSFDAFFTPRETCEIQAGFYGVPLAERRTDEILEALGLGDKKDAYVRMLSGGMKRRLLVAKALVHQPPVLILDEPTAGVDVELRRQLWDYVKELNARGVTIILTTHYLEEAQEMCDTIGIINHGKLIASEPKAELLKRLDFRTLRIDPREHVDAPPAALSELGAVVAKDGRIEIGFRSSERSVEELLERVRAAGVGIKDISIVEPDLEDVFVHLTTGV
ncbi:MAG: ABC transporter ATP-binding protein [Caulobacterales bacterium]